ncbi:thioredoxin [Roseibacillus persicicus]|uniref:Thioredoxin n=1 Tax=Roseibacillus persicicus TaxID=454148 RepID=A0A918TFN4_9BACT|nr:thioredoxin [Roseibacillus persicicus]MDQ8191469.1 thioredoxin [Roseibacillus persicicus]GHC43035.1 thioredoxin [Roseibacillus persicicus]
MTTEKSEILKLNNNTFEYELKQAKGPVLVDFWAEWCGPCKQMDPVLGKLAEELAGEATIAKVNVDESPALAQKYGVQSIPTFLVFKDGVEVSRKSGVTSPDGLKMLLD